MRDDVLSRKKSRIVSELAKLLSIGEDRAFDLFQSSETCRQMSDPKYGLHLMSDGYIIENLIAEIRSVGVAYSVYSFEILSGDKMTGDLAKELSEGFSSSYGAWSDAAPAPLCPGAQIRMSVSRYLSDYANANFKVVLCRDGKQLIGHAVYLSKQTTKGLVALVVQLVVSPSHRQKSVATEMMRRVWRSGDCYALAVVTSCPYTVRAMEESASRRAIPSRIVRDMELFKKEIFPDVPFLSAAEWVADGKVSVVNTRFWTSRSKLETGIADVECRLGEIPEGHEWFAAVFHDQEEECDGGPQVKVENLGPKSGVTRVKVLDVVNGCGSRESGAKVRAVVENLVETEKRKVIMDFDGVETCSSAFLDESVAKLLVKYGFSSFVQVVSLANVHGDIAQLMNHSVRQRLAENHQPLTTNHY